MAYSGCRPAWGESVEKLKEFIDLPQLGEQEWGAEAEQLLEKMQKTAADDYEVEEKVMNDAAESWCNPFGDDAAMASVGACACLSPVLIGMLFNWSSIFQ